MIIGATSDSSVIVVGTKPVTSRADNCCTTSYNNSPTASDVEAVDVDLKPTSTASPPHSHTAFCPILVVGTKKNSSGHTLCKTTQSGQGDRRWLHSNPECYHWIIPSETVTLSLSETGIIVLQYGYT